jgi:hypothetical protein
MRSLDWHDPYPAATELAGDDWADVWEATELADVLRSAMREEYADASDEEMGDALENVLNAMSPAEALSFGSALQSASRLVSDPGVVQVLRTAAPIAGGALGMAFGGPVAAGIGSQLGSAAARALAPRTAPPPAAAPPTTAAPAPSAPAPPPPAVSPPPAATPAVAAPAPAAAASAPDLPPTSPRPDLAPTPRPAPPVAGGSSAAAQGLVLSHHPDVVRSLLAVALGQYGHAQPCGVPNARMLAMLSDVFTRAAADADELMYLDQYPDAADSVFEEIPAGSARSLYADLLGADNLELAEAAEWSGLAS